MNLVTLSHITLWFGDASDDRLVGKSASGKDSSSAASRVSINAEELSRRDKAEIDLVHQIGMGSEIALRALYDQVYPTLWDFARSLTESRDSADDFTQDAFTILWHRAATWDDRAHVRGFLFTTVRNLTRNARRHQHFVERVEQSHRDEIAELAMAAIPGTPEERIQHHELISAVGRAVAALPEPRRTALLLRWKEQLPYEEIGRVLGISTVAAQRLVTRARTTVKEHVGPLLEP